MLDNDPLWYKDAVIYQVHVKAFFDSNDDGIGDFKGLTEKLDYIAALGATCVWLLPFFPSPMRDDGYDIADYRGVNSAFGTIDDFRTFVEAAHERGLRVLIELVINHTSDAHPWFQRARQAEPGSNERDFYVWSDSDARYAGTRIIFTDTETSNWTWDKVAGAFYWHRFFSHQPDLNFANPHVIEAVLDIMRFWLDTGVDGMRLDAVPYLCEREGTNNENLPETHGILKILRAVLDHEYPGKVFLAEANQWPEDVRPYFGDGDECQMAFHFPLMPRMFMAVAEEDRYPIVDIMRQTPEIPENCQWAIFLRNHDEMTLEMVTDRERDKMYGIYASDPRARINVGIRRRLAPLMQNDRRRIELLLGLLLSMPGTPIIYYGDEMGMGDNVYLNDRDGVRTPMQWSIDRNGGFSRADPARMYLPPIMDPVYGFNAVNAESQGRSPSSATNWLRRLIAVRQSHKAFGRGTIEFLRNPNRKVIAYVREYGDARILCVANLSRAAQQASLDLGDFAGAIPVEMVGWTSFQPIGTEPYLVTLPGHGFYWFLLSESAGAPSRDAERGQSPELHTLVLASDGANAALGAKALASLERDVLPAFLPKQRWYAEKASRLEVATVVDNLRLGEEPLIASLTIVETPGGRYFVPMARGADADDRPGALVRAAMAKTRSGPSSGYIYDGFAVDAFVLAALEFARTDARTESTRGGTFVGSGSPALTAIAAPAERAVRRLEVEQSNTSVVVDERLVVKGYRRVHAGAQPELEIARFFDRVGFRNTPELYGSIEHVASDGASTALVIVQAYVENRGDAWSTTLDYLDRFFDDRRRMADHADDHDDGHGDPHSLWLERIALLGTRTAEMHAAFAAPTDDPAFAAEPVTQADVDAWAARARASADAALGALAAAIDRVPAEVRPFAQSVLARRAEIDARLAPPSLAEHGGAGALRKTRFHGDYHLGQVLVTERDYVIVDFEGEPARSLDERRAKSSPLRDVAGMLRSINYAAVAGMRGIASDRAGDVRALEPLAADWERRSIDAFLASYRTTLASPGGEPAEALSRRLLDLFVLEKAFYEMSYELANRPSWVRIPLEGIRSILDPAAAAMPAGEVARA